MAAIRGKVPGWILTVGIPIAVTITEVKKPYWSQTLCKAQGIEKLVRVGADRN